MNIEEAKAKIKKLLMAEIDRLPSHYDTAIAEQVYSDTAKFNELLELNKIVSEALEKQIPKTPVDNIEQEWFECPTCRREIDWSKPKGNDCDFMFIDEVIAYDTQKED